MCRGEAALLSVCHHLHFAYLAFDGEKPIFFPDMWVVWVLIILIIEESLLTFW